MIHRTIHERGLVSNHFCADLTIPRPTVIVLCGPEEGSGFVCKAGCGSASEEDRARVEGWFRALKPALPLPMVSATVGPLEDACAGVSEGEIMETASIVAELNRLIPDERILADIHTRLRDPAEGGFTTISVDDRPRRVPMDVPLCIIKKAFSLAYLSSEESTVSVLVAVKFDPLTSDAARFDPELHCFGLLQYGCRTGSLVALAFQTGY